MYIPQPGFWKGLYPKMPKNGDFGLFSSIYSLLNGKYGIQSYQNILSHEITHVNYHFAAIESKNAFL